MPLSLFHFQFNPRKRKTFYVVDIFLHDTNQEMLDHIKRPEYYDEVIASFVPSKGTNRYVGAIHLSRDKLEIESIIHESYHAGIRLQKMVGRNISEKYEEKIVDSSASLAAGIIKLLLDEKEEITYV